MTNYVNESYNYDAFGSLLNGPTNPATNYLYTGQQFDSLTQLYDLRARYYNPGNGRFLSQDTWPVNFNNPIELNRYGYTANNPINFADPSGLLEGALPYQVSASQGRTSAAPALGAVSNKVSLIVAAMIASILQGAVAVVYNEFVNITKNSYRDFTIAIAFGFVQGQLKSWLTVNISSPPASVAHVAAFAAIRDTVKLGKIAYGVPDYFDGAEIASKSKHAERVMVELIRRTSGVDGPFVIGAVSRAVCSTCANEAEDYGSLSYGRIVIPPAFVLYQIKPNVQLLLLAPDVKFYVNPRGGSWP